MELLVGAEPRAGAGGGRAEEGGGAARVGLPLRLLRWWWRGWCCHVATRIPEIGMGRVGFDEAE